MRIKIELPALLGVALSCGVSLAQTPAPPAPPEIKGHSITYAVTADKTPDDIFAEAQFSLSLAKTCDAWTYGSALYYALDKGAKRTRAVAEQLTDQVNIYNERVNFSESLDGDRIGFRSSFRFNSRAEDATGAAFFDDDKDGLLQVSSEKSKVDTKLPKGSVPPILIRKILLQRLYAGERGPWHFRAVELGRFHMPVDLRFDVVVSPFAAPVAPAPAAPPAAEGKDRKTVAAKPASPQMERPPLLRGRAWALKQTSKAVGDWADSVFDFYDNGVIGNILFKREGVTFRALVRDINAFPEPKCEPAVAPAPPATAAPAAKPAGK